MVANKHHQEQLISQKNFSPKEDKDHLFGICPFTTTSRVVSGKWAILILYTLQNGPKRFGQLKQALPGIAETTLTKQLRQLEDDKLILRVVFPEVPPRVEYKLSPQGEKFKDVLDSIERFGKQYIQFLATENKK